MHQLKENLQKGIFQYKQRKSLKNIYERGTMNSTTQTLFPSKKNSINLNQIDSLQLTKADFYKTIGNTTGWGGWVRPQSKQACRKIMARPQTSKGLRKEPTNKTLFSNIQNDRFLNSKIKSTMNTKRKNNKEERQQNYIENRHNEYDQKKQIQIVINKRQFQGSKKAPSMHKNKFETDLDDQFLQLFAD